MTRAASLARLLNSSNQLTVADIVPTGNTVLGDAGSDTITFNANTLAIPNNLNIDSGTLFIDASNNNIGIGTSSPGAKFDVNDASSTGNATLIRAYEPNLLDGVTGARIVYGLGSSWNAGFAFTPNYATPASSMSHWQVNGTTLATLNGSGNLGIGTTSPSSLLHISKALSSTLTAGINIQNYGTFTWGIGIDNAVGGASLAFQSSGMSGTTRMVITSGGYVGIGTTSPSNKLSISGSGGTQADVIDTGGAYATLRTTNGTNTTWFGTDGSSPAVGPVANASVIWGFGAYPILFATSNAERMRIGSDGAVGIGNSSPTSYGASYANLWVGASGKTGYLSVYNGTVNLELNADGVGNVRTRSNTALVFGTNETERMRIDTSGNVGIGTNSPKSLLNIYQSSATAAGQYNSPATITLWNSHGASGVGGTIAFGADNPSNVATAFGASIWFTNQASDSTGTQGSLCFGTKGMTATTISERMRLNVDGFLGIGTTGPRSPLNVQGNTTLNNGGLLCNIYYSGGWKYSYSSTPLSFAIASDGNGVYFSTAPASGTVDAAATVTERMRIDTSGNVGIGTGTSIGAKLDVYAPNGSVQRLSVYDGQGSGNFGTDYYITNTQQTIGRISANYVSSGNSGYGSLQFYTAAGSGLVERVRMSYAGELMFNSNYGSVATAYGCRVWVNFNGQGTVTIRSSGNVSSITDSGTGKYVVNFTSAMPDINYCVNTSCSKDNDIDDGAMRISVGCNTTNVPSTSACPITMTRADGTSVDAARVYLSVHR